MADPVTPNRARPLEAVAVRLDGVGADCSVVVGEACLRAVAVLGPADGAGAGGSTTKKKTTVECPSAGGVDEAVEVGRGVGAVAARAWARRWRVRVGLGLGLPGLVVPVAVELELGAREWVLPELAELELEARALVELERVEPVPMTTLESSESPIG